MKGTKMHFFGKVWTQPVSVAGGCMLVGLSLVSAARAETVALVFEPPQVELAAICASPMPDNQLAAFWAAWDRQTLPDRSPDLIRRDMQRLIAANAIKWFDTIEAVYSLMPGLDSQFGPDKAMLARADLLIAAGRLKELTNQRLVEQLLQSEFGRSPRMQNTLADYLTEGIGIAADPERGLQMLIAAGYGGNADALLKIVTMQQQGLAVPGWDVPQDIAVTMAFGALVGKLDPLICDRVTRIAREYTSGAIVNRDIPLAEKWFRFAADLGDSSSAWKVAEMHMRSEDLVKSNDVLIEYLTKAADGGLPYAQITLGRAYEIGALVPRDLDRARRLYADAAAFGDRAGAIRNTLFLQAEAKTDPNRAPAYRAALTDLVGRDGAPGWAYAILSDTVLAEKGRWAGEAEAIALLEKASAEGDLDASKRLTPIRFRTATTPAAFYKVVDEVIESVHSGGEIDPMNGLKSAFTCRAPNAPQREEATYWGEISAATDTRTVEFSPAELQDLIANPDIDRMSRLQSQALYGRPTAMAQYIAVLERSGAPASQLAFWDEFARRLGTVLSSRGRLEGKFAFTDENLGNPADYLREAIAEGDALAGIDLAEYLLHLDPTTHAAEARAALQPLLDKGNGKALKMLPLIDPVRFPDDRAVFADYAAIIDTHGDFAALLLALPYLSDNAKVVDYISRATTVTECSFKEATAFAGVMGAMGDRAGFAKWIDIAEFLSEEDSWSLVQLGDLLRKFGGETAVAAQLAFYERGFAAGNVTAISRLLDVVSRPDASGYNPARAADLLVDLVARVEMDDLPAALSRLARNEPVVKDAVYARIDVAGLYRGAAEAGIPVAMREYGKLVRAGATTVADLERSTGWLGRAAEAGDVPAMALFADALAFGIGVEASRDEALLWVAKAASGGHEEAAATLRSLTLATPVSQ